MFTRRACGAAKEQQRIHEHPRSLHELPPQIGGVLLISGFQQLYVIWKNEYARLFGAKFGRAAGPRNPKSPSGPSGVTRQGALMPMMSALREPAEASHPNASIHAMSALGSLAALTGSFPPDRLVPIFVVAGLHRMPPATKAREILREPYQGSTGPDGSYKELEKVGEGAFGEVRRPSYPWSFEHSCSSLGLPCMVTCRFFSPWTSTVEDLSR